MKYTLALSGRTVTRHTPCILTFASEGQWTYESDIKACSKAGIQYPEVDEQGHAIFDTVFDAYEFLCAMDQYYPHFPTCETYIVEYKEYDFRNVEFPNWHKVLRDGRNRVTEYVKID